MRTALLVTVLLVAAGLRFTALEFGGPDFEARPDENGVVATLAAVERGRFFPTLVLYGGGYFEPLRIFILLWQAAFWDDGTAAQIAAGRLNEVRIAVRTWSALLSLVTVWLVYLVGRRAGDERAGLLAAALLAVLPLAVREARFGKADTAAAAAGALVMAALVLPRGGPRQRGMLAGAASALALGTKALASVLPAVVVGLCWPEADRRHTPWRALAWAAATCAVVFMALNGFAFRYPHDTAAMARFLLGALRDASWLPGGDQLPSPLVYHATVSLRWGCGWAVTLLAAPAVAYGLWSGGAPRVIALLAAAHALAVQASPMVLARFLLPALPATCVAIGVLIVRLVDRALPGGGARAAATAVIAVLLLVEPTLASLRLVELLGRVDTRSLAGDWIAAHIPAGARIVSWGAPPGAADYGRPPTRGRPVVQRLSPEQWTAGDTYVVWHRHPLPYSSDPVPAGVRLRRLVAFDSFRDERATDAVFEPIDAFYLPLGRLDRVERPGPRIEIFAVEPDD
ncbi:MAG TPA: glycosyltransferase family 39 protein [Candidatus Limnocylindria bacterium]|nr:glycosyltransferase family 39 protein [Candidatus Limnocylindria bacterium]